MSLYVLIALDDCRVKDCVVVETIGTALALRDKMIAIYGGANVCLASRERDDVPLLLHIDGTLEALDIVQ